MRSTDSLIPSFQSTRFGRLFQSSQFYSTPTLDLLQNQISQDVSPSRRPGLRTSRPMFSLSLSLPMKPARFYSDQLYRPLYRSLIQQPSPRLAFQFATCIACQFAFSIFSASRFRSRNSLTPLSVTSFSFSASSSSYVLYAVSPTRRRFETGIANTNISSRKKEMSVAVVFTEVASTNSSRKSRS